MIFLDRGISMFEFDQERSGGTACTIRLRAPRPQDGASRDRSRQGRQAGVRLVIMVRAGGGTIRFHDQPTQSKVFGYSDRRGNSKNRFGFLLDALQWARPPHGGIAGGN